MKSRFQQLRSYLSGRPRQVGAWGRRTAARLARAARAHTALQSVRQLHPAIAIDQQALLDFGRNSSDEFTALAENLAALDAGLAHVRTQAAALDAVLQDRDDDRALSSAFELYKRSVDLAHASIGIALSQEEQMEQMEQMEGRLLEHRDQFAQNSLLFRVLVMSLRAEAARIDPEHRATFTTVALEIATMEQQMSGAVGAAFAQIEAIVEEAAAGRAQLQTVQAEMQARAQQSITRLRAELEGIKQGLAPCAEASRDITTLLAQTRPQTNALVVSLQYQDIVSQQLGHVAQGFDDIASHLAPAAPGHRAKVDLRYLHAAARVQQTHLRSSRRAITEASDRIRTGSDALLETGAALVARFTAMEQAASTVFRTACVGDLFRAATDSLVQIAAQGDVTHERISSLLTRIETSVGVFSTEIRHHEFEVQLVALNSQLAAARVPAAGALNKLAEETARLAGSTALLTQEMSAQLRDTLSRLQQVRTEAQTVQHTIGRERTDLAAGAVTVSARLARLDARVHQGSSEVARHFDEAYSRARDLLPTLRFPALIAPSFAPAESLCARLLDATAAFADCDLTTEGADRLTAHRGRYTMRQETEAHIAALDTGRVDSGAAAVAVASLAAVELFSDCPDIAPASAALADAVASPAPCDTAPVLPSAKSDFGDGIELF